MPALTVPASSPAIRIHQGETIVAQAYSNTATQLYGFFRIVYDDGGEDDFTLNRTTLTNNRVATVMVSNQIAHRNGYVVSGQVCQVSGVANQASQRGQCFVRALVVSDPGTVQSGVASPAGCRAMLCQGYLYAGIDICVGQFVEPGPAGGHGSVSRTALAQPAAGADFAAVTLAVGSLWRVTGFYSQLVTGAGVANREFAIIAQTSGAVNFAGSAASEIQTATLTVDYVGAPGATASGVSASLGGGIIGMGLPLTLLVGGSHQIMFKTYNIQGLDQWAVGSLELEEWVMPN